MNLYLSKLTLNPTHGSVAYDVGNAHAMHQRVMQGFPDIESVENPRATWNVLYSLESLELLVQSCKAPEWDRLPAGYATKTRTKVVTNVLNAIAPERTFRFRILANPIRRDEDSKPRGITDPDGQQRWFETHAERRGFEVLDLTITPRPTVRGWKKLDSDKKKYRQIVHVAALFSGVLRVQDEEKFRDALMNGIGRGRSYGMGMLAIAPH